MPTPGNFLLDTSAAIGILRGSPSVRAALGSPTLLALPAIALGELRYGAERALKSAEEHVAIGRLVERCTLLGVDAATAEAYGRAKAGLARQGTPIPENDIWIAAMALRYDLLLLTSDQEHFSKVSGLPVPSAGEIWLARPEKSKPAP